MKRRQFIGTLVAGGATASLVGGTAAWISIAVETNLSIDAALEKLEKLSGKSIFSIGEWDPQQIFMHCAQSIEYSIYGFPEHKSEVFKNTLGQFAFKLFSSKGKMLHGLNEPIPGAASILPGKDIEKSLNYLKNMLLQFKQYKGELAPHFAYGVLSKDEYEAAHVMHIYEHLTEIKS